MLAEFGNPFEVVSSPGCQHDLSDGYEKYANYSDEAIMERTDAFLRQHGFMP